MGDYILSIFHNIKNTILVDHTATSLPYEYVHKLFPYIQKDIYCKIIQVPHVAILSFKEIITIYLLRSSNESYYFTTVCLIFGIIIIFNILTYASYIP